ncbi:MAG TPA: tetratricopeptide repeat protein, partial [Roseiflexaceae bacterium]|nr:tetratricopeptide repeat protein [Roseiflexaceae bacterium]
MSNWYVAAGARLLEAQADPAEAARLFERARDWTPQDPHTERLLAQAYLRLNQPQAAIQALERAYRRQPESILIRQELARAYEANGQSERAEAMWASLGMSGTAMIEQGKQAGAQGWTDEALRWY